MYKECLTLFPLEKVFRSISLRFYLSSIGFDLVESKVLNNVWSLSDLNLQTQKLPILNRIAGEHEPP